MTTHTVYAKLGLYMGGRYTPAVSGEVAVPVAVPLARIKDNSLKAIRLAATAVLFDALDYWREACGVPEDMEHATEIRADLLIQIQNGTYQSDKQQLMAVEVRDNGYATAVTDADKQEVLEEHLGMVVGAIRAELPELQDEEDVPTEEPTDA